MGNIFYSWVFTFLTIYNSYALDEKKAAHYEMESWKAYYAKNLEQAAHHLKGWMEEVYDLPNAETALLLLLKTMTAFGQLPRQTPNHVYQEEILPLLETTFLEIKKLSCQNFDVKLAAEKELEWWVARRLPDKENAENIGTLMSQMYAYLYGGKAENYFKAAYLRAEAACYRDLCQDRFGGRVTEEDWHVIRHRLELSYQELNTIISQLKESL